MANDLYELYGKLRQNPLATDLVFRGSENFLSNMYPAKVQIGNTLYNSAEGAFQAGKLRLPGVSGDTVRQLLPQFANANPYEARRLGRYGLKLTPEQLALWNSGEDDFLNPNAGKYGRMFKVLTSKFQNPDLMDMLQGTGDAYLREGTNIEPWGGDTNSLGRMLMLLRDTNK